MHPIFYGDVHSYAFFLALALLAGGAVLAAAGRRAHVPPRNLALLLAVAAGGALGGAKLYSAIERGGELSTWSVELFSGYRHPGGVFGLVVALACLRCLRALPPAAALADLIAPAFGAGGAVARIGCFLHGCCFGRIGGGPWGVVFPAGSPAWSLHRERGWIPVHAAGSLAVHPLQLYFLLLCAVLGGLAWYRLPCKRFDGEVALAFLALHGLAKSALESLRAIPALHLQIASLSVGLAASAAWLYAARRNVRRLASGFPLPDESGGRTDRPHFHESSGECSS